MIILDEGAAPTKDDKFNGLTLRHPQVAYIRSTSPLPDYDTSEAQHREVTTPSSKFKVDTKAWKAALYALGMYIFLTLAIAVPIIVVKSKDDAYHRPPPPPPSLWTTGNNNNPPQPSKMAFAGLTPAEEQMTCNNWQTDSNSPNSVIASFQLPPTGLVTIRSNITHHSIKSEQLNGTLSVSMNNNLNESSILFTIEMQSSSNDIQNQTSVCFSKEGNNRGLSIYIPSNIGDNNLAFNINVVLPHVKSNVDNFITHLPMFSQIYGDLPQYLNFNQFDLQGSYRPIYCKSLQAGQISVTNIMAAIQGSFNATDSVTLDSIKGPIITNVTLSPRPIQAGPTTLSLGTGDSAINASIILNAPPTTSNPPSSPVFAIQVNNFNGPLQLDVAYEKSSPASPFQLQVQNNVAESTIYMDNRFQGRFYVQTKLSEVFVRDTSQTLNYDLVTPNKATGYVGCLASSRVGCQSFVDVTSALGPVNLTFGS